MANARAYAQPRLDRIAFLYSSQREQQRRILLEALDLAVKLVRPKRAIFRYANDLVLQRDGDGPEEEPGRRRRRPVLNENRVICRF